MVETDIVTRTKNVLLEIEKGFSKIVSIPEEKQEHLIAIRPLKGETIYLRFIKRYEIEPESQKQFGFSEIFTCVGTARFRESTLKSSKLIFNNFKKNGIENAIE